MDGSLPEVAKKILEEAEQTEDEAALLHLLDSLEVLLADSPDTAFLKYGFEIGKHYRTLNRYDRSARLYSTLADRATLAKDSAALCKALFYQGMANNSLGMQNRALENLFSVLSISQALKDDRQRCLAYTHLGIVKRDQGLLDESIEYFNQALAIANSIGESSITAASLYNNIGSAHKLKKDFPRAKEYFLLALEINKREGYEKNMSYNYNNLANIYEETGDLDNALNYHQKSIEIKERINDKPNLAVSFSNIAIVYMKTGNDREALKYVENGIALAEEYKIANILPTLYGQYAMLLAKKNNFKKAFEVMQTLKEYRDSIAQMDKQAIISQMEARYERQMVVNENQLLRKDIETSEAEIYRKDAFLVVLIICVSMLLLVIFTYYQSFKRRTEANKKLQEQNEAIIAQKDRIEMQKRRIEESTFNLEQAKKDKEVFFSTISHDMRGPISAISAIVKMMKQDAEGRFNEELQVMDYSAKTLLSLVEDIMDFSNLESGRLHIEQKTFDIKELLDDIAKSFEFISNEKDVDLVTDLEDPGCLLLGDPKRIGQVVFNLLGNAFKFTREGFVKLSMKAKQEDEASMHLTIRVQDTGIGIDESKLDIIFNKFEQATKDIYKDFGGSGLGLYITKHLIGQMGGTVTVTSKLGEGTEFVISLVLPTVRQPQA